MTIRTCLPYDSTVANGNQPARQQRRTPSWLVAAVFFLEVFGLTSVAMGGAMMLAAAPRVHETVPPSDVARRYDDTYLELFAKGPGRGWYLAGQASCATNQSCEQP